MNWKIVNHKDLSMAEGLRIAYLKDQHWPYGLESQILWMRDNIEAEDTHLMGEEQHGEKIDLLAYLTFTKVKTIVDEEQNNCIGVGGVCVDKSKQRSGLGKLLLQEAARYIITQEKTGILLCKDALVPFYEKCGWKLLKYQTAFVAGMKYEHNIMLLDKDCNCSNIILDKNF